MLTKVMKNKKLKSKNHKKFTKNIILKSLLSILIIIMLFLNTNYYLKYKDNSVKKNSTLQKIVKIENYPNKIILFTGFDELKKNKARRI